MKKNTIKFQFILSGLLGLFSVIFLWWFFSSGVSALGLNITTFWILFIVLFLMGIENKAHFIKKNLYWFIPYFIIILSYSFYEIPFLKNINIWLLPLLTLFFFWFSVSTIDSNHSWDFKTIWNIIFRKIYIKKNTSEIINTINSWDDSKRILYKKIITGIIIFLCINMLVISLLMSADNNFQSLVWDLWKLIHSWNIFKIFIALVLSIIFISFANLWKTENRIESKISLTQIDSVIGGIVLGWTLVTYIVFIIAQLDTLFTSPWSTGVQHIANLAKSWFWQLFVVSIINIIFFFVYYKKTTPIVQKILWVFMFASVIILFSAAIKMYSYTSIYGLSYEKFFASYTILYFWALFLWMIFFILLNKKIDILKISILLAFWMYSAIHIFPVEIFIFQANTNILQQKDTKIPKYQSHMLSIDILSTVNQIKWQKIYINGSWQEWSDKKIEKSLKKPWYEKNIQDFKVQK